MNYYVAGNLYVCEHVTSSLIVETRTGERKVLATHWQGKELNSPNDVVVRSDDTVFFTDPTFGRMPCSGSSGSRGWISEASIACHAMARCTVKRTTSISQTACAFTRQKILYVNDTTRARIRAFDVGADGSFSCSRIFANHIGTGDYNEGVVDGMKCDEHGNIYVTGPRGIWVFSAQGKHLGIIRMPEIAGNLNWAAATGRALLHLFDVDLSRADEGARQSGRLHADALILCTLAGGCRARAQRSFFGQAHFMVALHIDYRWRSRPSA